MSTRVSTVASGNVDPTLLDAVEELCAAAPPTDSVAFVLRDVIAAMRWLYRAPIANEPRVIVKTTREIR